MASLFDLIALTVVIVWPVIPLFWIPVHCFASFFRKLGLLTYLFPAATWTPLALFLIGKRELILAHRIGLFPAAAAAGAVLLALGIALQVWSGRALTLRGLMGMPEVSENVESRFVATGPYLAVRHPTYLSHTMMFAGVFLMTGLVASGVVTLLDFLLIRFIVIPLEEKELSVRFGPAYDQYRIKVPAFFPWKIFSRP